MGHGRVSDLPEPALEIGSAAEVHSGVDEICILGADGALSCVSPAFHDAETPSQVSLAQWSFDGLPVSTRVSIDTFSGAGCAIHGQGEVACWGNALSGTPWSSGGGERRWWTSIPCLANVVEVRAVSDGPRSTTGCTVTSDRDVVCFGRVDEDSGQA